MTVLSPSLPPLSCRTTSTLLPCKKFAFPSNAFRNFGSIIVPVASDPSCKNFLRLIPMILFFGLTQLIFGRTHQPDGNGFDPGLPAGLINEFDHSIFVHRRHFLQEQAAY